MGFMDKAKQLAEQLATQKKLDEAQTKFNDSQRQKAEGQASQPSRARPSRLRLASRPPRGAAGRSRPAASAAAAIGARMRRPTRSSRSSRG